MGPGLRHRRPLHLVPRTQIAITPKLAEESAMSTRRDFLKTTAVAGAAATLAAASYARVVGANEKIGIAFIGVGGRCQAHLDIVNKMAKENKDVQPVAVCDVWDGFEEKY